MKFPGSNRLNLSSDTLKSMAESELLGRFGSGIRITDIGFESYPTRLRVEFTTDAPEPEAPEAPAPRASGDDPF